MVLLEVRELSKRFGRQTAVKDVSFSVEEGEVYGILGPNGAGKTTLLSMICGILKPGGGSISVGGRDMRKSGIEAKALIGLVPQEIALYPQLSARANLRFWGGINGLKGKELSGRIAEVLRWVGLEERVDERVDRYSGGMKRRLNLAVGLLHRPRLLIMDEPTVGVDPQSRNHILEHVRQLRGEGTTIIYTSHYVEEVEYLCDRVAIIDGGRILMEGTVTELLRQAGEHQEILITPDRPAEKALGRLRALPGVAALFSLTGGIKILTPNAEAALPLVFETLMAQGVHVSEIKIRKPDLESLFLKLTGRALRD